MDRSLKARLIGASVLVLLVVLVVPELLSGRKTGTAAPTAKTAGGQTRTYTIELAGSSSAGTAQADAVHPSAPGESPLAADGPAPTPQPSDSEADAPPPQKAPVTPAEATTAAPAIATMTAKDAVATATPPAPRTPTAAPQTAAVGHGTWSVQVGAFGSAESARRLVSQLEADGFDAYVSTARRDGRMLHRVRVGPEPGRSQADSLAGRLKARGLPVSVVAND